MKPHFHPSTVTEPERRREDEPKLALEFVSPCPHSTTSMAGKRKTHWSISRVFIQSVLAVLITVSDFKIRRGHHQENETTTRKHINWAFESVLCLEKKLDKITIEKSSKLINQTETIISWVRKGTVHRREFKGLFPKMTVVKWLSFLCYYFI